MTGNVDQSFSFFLKMNHAVTNDEKEQSCHNEALNSIDNTTMSGTAYHDHPLDVMESHMGITVYLSPEFPGFSAVSKARYSDFCVHEGKLQSAMKCIRMCGGLFTLCASESRWQNGAIRVHGTGCC
jgi:hypothetical protein